MSENHLLHKAWQDEYQRKGIPSSYRKDPTQTVVKFIDWLKEKGFSLQGQAADIGCGQGRNSIYLADQGFDVISMDWLKNNIAILDNQIQLQNLAIKGFVQDVACQWPIPSNTLSIAVDVFCYKHLIDKQKQAAYRKELHRTLKQDGFYFISLASEKDGFYGSFLKQSTDIKNKLIIDPFSTIPSFLYSIQDLQNEFSDYFQVVEINEQQSISPMYENNYERVVLNAIFKPL